MGPAVQPDNEATETSHVYHVKTQDIDLEEKVHAFWSTESFGTKYEHSQPLSTQDRQLMQKLEQETELVEGKYVVPMLWKSTLDLPNNYRMAERRLNTLSQRFRKIPDLFAKYSKNINEYLEKGYARHIDENDDNKKESKQTWYFPHHPVTNPNKPGKVRTVLDAAPFMDKA